MTIHISRARRAAGALAMLAVLASGCAKSSGGIKAPVPVVSAAAAAVRTVHPSAQLSGVVAPLQNVAITSDLQEPAASVPVNEGDVVRAGQVLVALSTADLQAQLEAAQRSASEADAKVAQTRYQAQYSISSGNDQVRNAQAALDLAESTMQRDKQLAAQGYISQQQVDQQQTAVTQAQAALSTAIENQRANGDQHQGMQQANIDAAIAAAASAHAQADSISAQIAKATIVAPVDGVVVNRNINPGEYPGTRQIFTLQEVSSLYAALSAYGSQISGINPSDAVSISSPSVPGKHFEGKVVAVLSPTAPTAAGFVVKIIIPNPQRTLLPGMTVSAQVRKRPVTGVSIPAGAFVDDTHTTILTIDADKKAHLTKVTELARDANYSVVTGIAQGALVVSNGTLAVADGQQVEVQ
ncbi:MAG: efflux RND transporter periplasmic adaptor subunit [Candidatus Eremiobacteraeota bacterium]|nr:efflux RND transporter periplasmic adaptor subunit [Candidatus Eremiobacteraeota bacterium]MBV8223472.1 efflux RND transporter periplasmic adaptor subunit [Candidatus Eremiobacteraeota bacterium]MBV8281099.1 efflux RND transporter periplasmic adaptor subunit [Candidatus Eremiobacteraeota bacterium]